MNIKCPICHETFSPKGLAIHHGRRHAPNKPCRYRGENRGWCVVHDGEWRIDRARCEPWATEGSEA